MFKGEIALKNAMKKFVDFMKEYGHRIFTFAVGLAFISLVFYIVGFTAVKIYRVFKPNNIYTDPNYANSLYGGSVYEAQSEESPEEGTPEFFEDYIENLIRQDMPDFQDPLDLGSDYMVSYGIWQAIKLNNAQGVYTFDSKNNYRVPADDVEMFAQYCFDYPEKIKHGTVKLCGEFSYNILNKTYKVRSAGVEEDYMIPDVIDVEFLENDTYVLTVDCYNQSLIPVEDPTNDPDNLAKRVKITMQDLGIHDYTITGKPVHRYIFLSMETVEIDPLTLEGENQNPEQGEENTEQTEQQETEEN